MILLDTNVISEVVRPKPDPRVLQFLDHAPPGLAWISSITVAEVRLGVLFLPVGKRRSELAATVDRILGDFSGLCVSFDALAAEEFAEIVASRRRAGRPISHPDAQIAAIARSAGLLLATRNVGDFSAIENLTLVNPWETHEPR